MTHRLITCVPNFSEGRDPSTIHALINAVQSVPGVRLLDRTSDVDHHRTVLTFAGEPDAVGEAALRAIRLATTLIDLRRHDGVHPRVGATDVVPFVPVHGVTMDDCVRLARRIGQQVGSDLGIPVFLYERAASRPERVPLESIRRGGPRGLASRMETDPAWIPDYGPPHLHETAGAIVIGARPPLIAFNVNLKSGDVSTAQAIAKTVRQSNGGLPCVKAIGVPLPSRGLVQVSMNLTDYHVTSLFAAFQAVSREAAKRAVELAGSELIGLVPQEAWDRAAAASLQLEGFDRGQILEERLRAVTMLSGAGKLGTSVSDFLEAVAAATPAPAGGSVAALVGALAAALGVMGVRLTPQAEREPILVELSQRLRDLVEADMAAYEEVARAGRLSQDHPGRLTTRDQALYRATQVPLDLAECACRAGSTMASYRAGAKPAVQSDVTVGIILAIAAAEAALHTARVNMKRIINHELKSSLEARLAKTVPCLEELKALCYTPPS